MRPAKRPRFSYRDDPQVPAFDEGGILLVMDGDCALCSGAARRIARWDRAEQVRICTATHPLGQALLAHYALSPEDPTSWLMLQDGQARGSLEAILCLLPQLRPGFVPVRLLRLVPLGLQDWIYARIARNRYRFGKTQMCALPDAALQRRLIR